MPTACFQPPGGDGFKQGFGVAMPAPAALGRLSARLQLLAKLGMVVDFAIVVEHQAAVGRDHGLVPGRRQIDDGQPAVGEADPGLRVGPDAGIVRTAMGNGVAHAAQHGLVELSRRQQAGNSAHRQSALPGHDARAGGERRIQGAAPGAQPGRRHHAR
jgi:hypothetical protein